MGYVIVITGSPLVGKSSQAEELAKRFPNMAVVDTGQLLRNFDPGPDPSRQQLKNEMDRQMAEGLLLESTLVQEILGPELEMHYGNNNSDVEMLLFPGSPRKMEEAEWLMNSILPRIGFSLLTAYHLDVTCTELERRRQNRKGREKEDTPEGFADRLVNYKKDTVPVIEHFASMNMLVKIDGNRSIEQVTDDLAAHIFAATL